MSKQSEAKERQGYVSKAKPTTCMNCWFFRFDVVLAPVGMGAEYDRRKNLRCEIGGFAVKKMGTCNKYQA